MVRLSDSYTVVRLSDSYTVVRLSDSCTVTRSESRGGYNITKRAKHQGELRLMIREAAMPQP